jgi:hypothetical protein
VKPYTDWSRFRLGLVIGVVWALILNGIGYVAGMKGIEFPGKNLGMALTMAFYFALGYWTARDANSRNDGVSQGLSIGLGAGVGALIVTLPGFIYLMSKDSDFPLLVFTGLAIFGELKWSAIALVGGTARAKQNTPPSL